MATTKRIRKTWKRVKHPNEVHAYYARIINDLDPGDSIVAVTASVVEGDVTVANESHINGVVGAVLSGGTENSVVRFTVTTTNGYTIVWEGILQISD